MKIILHYPNDLPKESAEIIMDWIKEMAADKSTENTTPLRYVERVEIE